MQTDLGYSATQTMTLDQAVALKGLQDLAQGDFDKHQGRGLWEMTKNALAAIRSLQAELTRIRRINLMNEARIAELETLVTMDELTKLSNRRGFYDAFDREIDRCNRGQTLGGVIIMIDLDNFKVINDTYGHAAGDEALSLVAQLLQTYSRKMDVAARLGGDEFALLFANADKQECVERVQRLARKLNSLILKHKGHRIPIRASLGIQPYGKGARLETIMDRADAKMYEEKESKKTN